mgnify:CR=1 FL=1
MKHRKNSNLHVVREPEDPTDKIIDEIMDELNSEDGKTKKEIQEELARQKKAKQKKLTIGIAVVAAVGVLIYLLINLQTYTKVRVSDTYVGERASDNNYIQFMDGVLKYSKDGISYLGQTGKEKWNQSYQIKNPMVDINEKSAVVADKEGNDILIFQEEGLKGEVHTTMPIEKACVSEQGIVSAILKNDTSMKVMCYDTAGNILVEHKTSLAGSGYPVDVALSADGEVMQVLYLYTQKGQIVSKVHYYNFGEAGKDETDHKVSGQNYKDTIMVSGFFMDSDTSVAIGDNCMAIYTGKDIPHQSVKVTMDKEIKSVFHNKKYIGMILKNQGKGGYELRLYNKAGKVVLSKEFEGDYGHVKLCGKQVIMYDGKNCSIFMKNGVQKFKGRMDNNILEIFPVGGVNQYIVLSANGMEKVRLVK